MEGLVEQTNIAISFRTVRNPPFTWVAQTPTWVEGCDKNCFTFTPFRKFAAGKSAFLGNDPRSSRKLHPSN
jgi:hypothetical protein